MSGPTWGPRCTTGGLRRPADRKSGLALFRRVNATMAQPELMAEHAHTSGRNHAARGPRHRSASPALAQENLRPTRTHDARHEVVPCPATIDGPRSKGKKLASDRRGKSKGWSKMLKAVALAASIRSARCGQTTRACVAPWTRPSRRASPQRHHRPDDQKGLGRDRGGDARGADSTRPTAPAARAVVIAVLTDNRNRNGCRESSTQCSDRHRREASTAAGSVTYRLPSGADR